MVLVSSFIALPNSVQETVLEAIFSVGAGFFFIILGRLYHINICLPFIPVFALIAMVYFYIYSNSTSNSTGQSGKIIKRSESVHPDLTSNISLLDENLNQEINTNDQKSC